MSASPNILVIVDDQHRHSAMGCYGNEVIKTPHFDAFAEQGRVFDNAYANCPISAPFRAQLLTGRYPHANGVICNEYALREDQTFFPQALSSLGYRTGYVGKWHLGMPPYTPEKRYGFDYFAAYNCNHRYYEQFYHENEEGPIKIEKWGPEGETDIALKFIEAQVSDEKRFALFLSWGPPHWPYDQYPDEFNIYDPQKVDLPPNVPKQMEHFARQEIADYYGNVSALDAQFGRLMAGLDRLNIADDTIVLFTSDHGDHLSSHGYGKPGDMWMHRTRRKSKATPYEESVHIPLLARWPGHIPAGTRTDSLISCVDLMPSLLRMCGAEVPEGVQGGQCAHTFTGDEGLEADSVYLQILGPGWPKRVSWSFWRGLRTRRWTYARYKDNDLPTELFDNENDPYQLKNLAFHPEYAETRSEMENRLQRWIEETEDPFDTGKRDPESGILELGQRFIDEKYLSKPQAEM